MTNDIWNAQHHSSSVIYILNTNDFNCTFSWKVIKESDIVKCWQKSATAGTHTLYCGGYKIGQVLWKNS